MGDEDAFQAHLDANPDDYTARLVFADWLQDRDDPRAEGYRAMGSMGRSPAPLPPNSNGRWNYGRQSLDVPCRPAGWYRSFRMCLLPDDWFAASLWPGFDVQYPPPWRYYQCRRRADDCVALAFSKLPASAGPNCSRGCRHE